MKIFIREIEVEINGEQDNVDEIYNNGHQENEDGGIEVQEGEEGSVEYKEEGQEQEMEDINQNIEGDFLVDGDSKLHINLVKSNIKGKIKFISIIN